MLHNIGFSSYGYDDFRISMAAVKIGATKNPGWEKWRDDGAGSTGLYTYTFSPTAEEEVFFEIQMPHTWLEGTPIYPMSIGQR